MADQNFLENVWKRHIRKHLKSLSLRDLNLTPDPIYYAGYDWGSRAFISELVRDVRDGRYAPERGEIVRSAKSKGLSRPVCFLSVRDALVYRAIVLLAAEKLLDGEREWVGHERSDKGTSKEAEDSGSESFDWFRFWLSKQGLTLQMVEKEDVDYLVESDVANFFPSIRLEAIREHLYAQTDLEKELVRLCVQIIDGVIPRSDYSESSILGLPQEVVGSSRTIAQSLLSSVDKEFDLEGESGKYARYMDDVLIGVSSIEDGHRCISRLQRSLEPLGLHPNVSKTSVTRVDKYLEEAMVETNAVIDRIQSDISSNKDVAEQSVLEELIEVSSSHRMIDERPKRWDRVSRRLYTLHRRLGIDIWWGYWKEDLIKDPSGAAVILEYIRSWPLNKSTIQDLIDVSSEFSHLYMNVPMLIAEVIATAPVSADRDLWGFIYSSSRGEMLRIMSDSSDGRDRISAAWLVAAWKFANNAQKMELLSKVDAGSESVSPLRIQALPMLASVGESISDWVSAKPGLRWEDAISVEYLRSLLDGDQRAQEVGKISVSPKKGLSPQRYLISPRAIPLIEILGKTRVGGISDIYSRNLKKLASNEARLRDFCSESVLQAWNVDQSSF
ncbi:RNA-directed DNA polymerase [Nocardiopsis alba]|uniref:RNA-directed DNA polymerase n=1 Tax=Nocardiopsis alba TaxID=53437 RepID=UPI0033E4E886